RAAAEGRALEGDPAIPAGSLYDLACAFALAVGPARTDARLPASARAVLAERYAVQAVAVLRKLPAQGYFPDADRRKLLRTEPDFQALRDRTDFRQLLLQAESAKQR